MGQHTSTCRKGEYVLINLLQNLKHLPNIPTQPNNTRDLRENGFLQKDKKLQIYNSIRRWRHKLQGVFGLIFSKVTSVFKYMFSGVAVPILWLYIPMLQIKVGQYYLSLKSSAQKTVNMDLSVPLVKLFQSSLTHTTTGLKSQV